MSQSQAVQAVYRYAFVQAMMQRKYLAEAAAKQLLLQISGQSDDGSYNSMVSDINEDLTFLKYHLKTAKFLGDGKKYIGIVNTVADDACKEATLYRHEQLVFFRALIEKIAVDGEDLDDNDDDDDNGNSNGMAWLAASEALNVRSGNKPLSMREKQDLLPMFVDDGWLCAHPQHDHYFGIGVRTFLELSEFLLSLDLPETRRTAWQEVL